MGRGEESKLNDHGVLVFLIAVGLYFTPAIIAAVRSHQSENAIGLLNFFLGWTVLGWLVALIWASSSITKTPEQKGWTATCFACQSSIHPRASVCPSCRTELLPEEDEAAWE